MKKNYEINRAFGYREGVSLTRGAFSGIPAIVVSAGASLNLNAAYLKDCEKKALIVCVTRAALTLSQNGVKPDFYVAADAGSYILDHLSANDENISAPLFLLSTADAEASEYKGEKFIIYEKNSAPESGCYVETGGSVATAALSLCVNFGANPIVLIGQDLCYRHGFSHSDGKGPGITPLKGGKHVLANDGNRYYTMGNLYIFLKWIERFIKRNKNTEFFNATAIGAIIDGAPNVELREFFGGLPDVRQEIDRAKKDRGIG